MERILCLAAGYACGLIQTGYFYSKSHDVDIRKHGSGNSGSTNILRVMGVKAGAIVFFGDFFKTLIPCLLVRFLFRDRPEIACLMLLYTALGVILGHNYPFYLKFKGGKGIAATAGLLVALDLRVTLVVTIFLAFMIVFGQRGDYGLGASYLPEFYAVSAAITAMAFWRHRSNIVRLVQGKENKIGKKS